jgi:hypothetical protein
VLREEMMAFILGSTVLAQGCLTRLIDVVNREPALLEDLVGFHRFRLSQGFYFLSLLEALLPGDFEFFGYTYMSGGKLGLPSNNPTIESARPKVHDTLMARLQSGGVKVAPDVIEQFVRTIQLKGHERYVKIVPFIGHDESMGPADQYPSSKLGIKQLKLKRETSF